MSGPEWQCTYQKITVSRPRETSVPVVIFSMIFPFYIHSGNAQIGPTQVNSDGKCTHGQPGSSLEVRCLHALAELAYLSVHAFHPRECGAQRTLLLLAIHSSRCTSRQFASSGPSQSPGEPYLCKTPYQTIFFCMKIAGKIAVVTGGANGIGRALCLKFAAQGAKAVIISDIDVAGAATGSPGKSALRVSFQATQAEAIPANVAKEAEVKNLVDAATQKFGQIDIFCSNAGVGVGRGPDTADSDWALSWDVNLMAHVYAARAVLPQMLARKEGYLLQTVSAAGLLTHIGSAPYSVTKHAALGFAEWLAINYGEQGVRVSALCPQGVKTNMLMSGGNEFLFPGALEPEQVADDVIKAMDEERFLVLPHPEAGKYFLNKATDYDRWIRNMRKMRSA